MQLEVNHNYFVCKISDEKKKIIEKYNSGNIDERKLMEKRYGKKQLATLVQTVMSEDWIENESKCCPHCKAPIQVR